VMAGGGRSLSFVRLPPNPLRTGRTGALRRCSGQAPFGVAQDRRPSTLLRTSVAGAPRDDGMREIVMAGQGGPSRKLANGSGGEATGKSGTIPRVGPSARSFREGTTHVHDEGLSQRATTMKASPAAASVSATASSSLAATGSIPISIPRPLRYSAITPAAAPSRSSSAG
jgi:hypothetical protein